MENNQSAADGLRAELEILRPQIIRLAREIAKEQDTSVRREKQHLLESLRCRENRTVAALSDLAHSFYKTGVN